jgi:hypothetical protein
VVKVNKKNLFFCRWENTEHHNDGLTGGTTLVTIRLIKKCEKSFGLEHVTSLTIPPRKSF